MAAKRRFAVELKAGKSPASFMADGQRVVLDDDSPRYETTSGHVYLQLQELPFLKALGEVKPDTKKGDG